MMLILLIWFFPINMAFSYIFGPICVLSRSEGLYVSLMSSICIITDYKWLHSTQTYLYNPDIIYLTCGESQHILAVFLMADTKTD